MKSNLFVLILVSVSLFFACDNSDTLPEAPDSGSVSGTSGRISFVAPSGLSDRSTVTLKALDNTNFGTVGSILLFASDAKNTAPGMALDTADFDGVGVWRYNGDVSQLMVERCQNYLKVRDLSSGRKEKGKTVRIIEVFLLSIQLA